MTTLWVSSVVPLIFCASTSVGLMERPSSLAKIECMALTSRMHRICARSINFLGSNLCLPNVDFANQVKQSLSIVLTLPKSNRTTYAGYTLQSSLHGAVNISLSMRKLSKLSLVLGSFAIFGPQGVWRLVLSLFGRRKGLV